MSGAGDPVGPGTPAGVERPPEGSGYLGERLAGLDRRIRELIAHRRADDPAPDDPFRGLYVSDEVADYLLDRRPAPPGPASPDLPDHLGRAPGEPRLLRLARGAGLTGLDVDILVIALAPDLDTRYERLYGYLNDDVSRRRATIGLALELAGVPVATAAARARMLPGSPLIEHRLLLADDADRPVLSRALRVPDRVSAHLLGDDSPDDTLVELISQPSPHETATARQVAVAVRDGVRLVYLRERGRRSARSTAAWALRSAGLAELSLDLRPLAALRVGDDLAVLAGREALLRGGAVIAGPVDDLRESRPGLLRALTTLPVPVVLTGEATWDPAWSPAVPLLLDAPELGTAERLGIWQRAVCSTVPPSAGGGDLDPAEIPVHLPLGPEQIGRAVRAAAVSAEAGATAIDGAHLRAGARQQNAAGLERLARRIEPGVAWADLVLPAPVSTALHELAARARHRGQVLTDWRMRPGGGRGRGVTALFAGDSGTGKTMSAEVIAGELGLDLYTVDLATVVDKYVGETEKNLERIFAEAGGVNGVLLFDEADAVFGKRSEVRDAHDRYANIESAYLLQRMETFDGLAVLATNLRANIDEAFTRRLDSVIDFPTPDASLREALWDRCLGPHVPRGDDLDLAFCARAFELSGGAIRSVAVTAAYLAAEAGTPVGMTQLIGAVQREYRKLGRLLLENEFGPYFRLLATHPAG